MKPVLFISIFGVAISTGDLNAQSKTEHGIRITTLGALQWPTVLELEGFESKHMARHVFLSVAYRRSLSARFSLGLGAGLSWSTYGVSVAGSTEYQGSQVLVDGENWSSVIWFPFEGDGISLRTDPYQIWLEAIRQFGNGRKRSFWSMGGRLGFMAPAAYGFGLGTDVRLPDPARTEPVRANSDYGYTWLGFMGLDLAWNYAVPSGDLLCLGLDWRASSGPYFDHSLAVLGEDRRPEAIVSRSVRFMWVGVSIGYEFRWGGSSQGKGKEVQ